MLEVAHEVAALQCELFGEAVVSRLAHQFLDARQRMGRAIVQALGQRQRLMQGAAGIGQPVDHAQGLQSCGVDAVPAHQDLMRQRAGQHLCQAPAGTAIGRQARVDMVHGKHRVARGHHQVACQRE
ncbi:hypothetical protein D3C81_1895000 [compost metagenome]